MAQLFIPEIDDAVEVRLVRRALRHGRSLEVEVRLILEKAVREEPGLREEGAPMQGVEQPTTEKGFGDLMYERFKDIGLKDDEVRRFNDGIEEFNSSWEMGLPDFEADEYEVAPSRK